MAQTLHYSSNNSQLLGSNNISSSTDVPPPMSKTGQENKIQNIVTNSDINLAEPTYSNVHKQNLTTPPQASKSLLNYSKGISGSGEAQDLEWTSFAHDSGTDDTPESRRRFSESEQQNLLLDDYAQFSDDDDAAGNPGDECPSSSKNYVIGSPEWLRSFLLTEEDKLYYCRQFERLLRASDHSSQSISALRGSHPVVQEFFRKSNLTQAQLSKIWTLADVNTDGYLNLNEFNVAMHLIVRCVKGNYEVPEKLPKWFRPAATPPLESGALTSPDQTIATTVNAQVVKHSSTTLSQESSGSSEKAAARTAPPPQLTSQPPGGTSGVASVAHPKPRRGISPDVNNLAQKQFVLSPQTLNPPKGPPPKPPPRPAHQQLASSRHTRSVSLDLKTSRFSPTSVTSEPAGLQLHHAHGSAIATETLRCDAATQTDTGAEQASFADQMMTSPLMLGATGGSTAAERCRTLLAANAELERQYQRLAELRQALQVQLKNFLT